MSLVDAVIVAGYTVSDFLLLAAAGFVVLAIGMLYRAVKGPTMQDRGLYRIDEHGRALADGAEVEA